MRWQRRQHNELGFAASTRAVSNAAGDPRQSRSKSEMRWP